MIQFRPHKGGLQESLRETRKVHVIEDLYRIINALYGQEVQQLEAEHHGHDPRCDWDTYLVTARFAGADRFFPVGWSDGDFSTLFP